jgi:hypothetical protein
VLDGVCGMWCVRWCVWHGVCGMVCVWHVMCCTLYVSS